MSDLFENHIIGFPRGGSNDIPVSSINIKSASYFHCINWDMHVHPMFIYLISLRSMVNKIIVQCFGYFP